MSQNLYPFRSKAQIKADIAESDVFMKQCLLVMYSRQTDVEQQVRETKDSNKRGFMSSHAVNGSKLAEKVLAGEDLSAEDTALARKIVGSYSKQLAAHFRDEAIRANPALKAVASLFSAG